MFESHEKLAGEIRKLLGALRALGEGRYACLLERKGVLMGEADPEAPPPWPLRRFLEERTKAIFAIPAALVSEAGVEEDAFAEWEDDGFFLVFVNGRVAIVVACPEPEALEEGAGPILKVLVDRMIRYNGAWRADEKGRGFFFSQPRLDTVVVTRSGSNSDRA